MSAAGSDGGGKVDNANNGAEIGGSTSQRQMTIAALGVAFGDIGTSPLYALRESFRGPDGPLLNRVDLFGVLSLILWSLILIVSVKYLLFVLRADNRGEGGIIALFAVQSRGSGSVGRLFGSVMLLWFLVLAVLGFGSSNAMASAYGVAVSMDIVVTTILAVAVACRFNWRPGLVLGAGALFVLIDTALLGANLAKIPRGGRYALLIAALIFTVMWYCHG